MREGRKDVMTEEVVQEETEEAAVEARGGMRDGNLL